MFNVSRKHLAFALGVLVCAAGSAGCDFYEGKLSGEFNAGSADPYNFPPPYRGAGARREIQGTGSFSEIAAFAKGQRLGYFSFPFSPSQVATTGYNPPSAAAWPEQQIDPLRVEGPGTDFRRSGGNPVPVPLVYNFDAPTGAQETLAATPSCKAPEGYTYDRFAEAYPKTEQWNVFTFLPDRFTSFGFAALPTWSYRPLVAEVAVTSSDVTCQDVKSERTLLSLADQGRLLLERAEPEPDGTRYGKPTGRYLAWALIDPASPVLRVGQASADVIGGGEISGTSVQKYGWYGQFIVAYIDGGVVPTEPGPTVAGKATKRIRPQRLYYPRSRVAASATATAADGALGRGYDVVQASRFDDPETYSPVCEVWTYALPGTTLIADLPKSEEEILARAGSTLEPARTTQPAGSYTPASAIVPRYVFCLQAAKLP